MTKWARIAQLVQAGWSGDRILVGVRFSAPVHTGLVAHPASYTMGTGSFQGIKQLDHDVYHPPLSSPEVKETVEVYLFSTSEPSWPVVGWTLPLWQTKHTSICLATSVSRTLCYWGEEYSTSSEKLTVVYCSILWGEKGIAITNIRSLHWDITWFAGARVGMAQPWPLNLDNVWAGNENCCGQNGIN
jgi:hypothetical protein